MHAVDIGIGGDDDVVVAQVVQRVLDVEGGLEGVQLLVFVDHLLCLAVGVHGLASQREYGLGAYVADFGDGARCRQSLGDED